MKRAFGFTLIELLIVVAIIAILAAIAVPNFLEAQTRAKVSRTKNDMRTATVALESYFVDNNKYPAVVSVANVAGYQLPSGPGGPTYRAAGLTSPISYLTSIPTDPFGKSNAKDQYNQPGFISEPNYWYATKAFYELPTNGFPWDVYAGGSAAVSNKADWVLLSKGPDSAWSRLPGDGGVGTLEVDQPTLWQYDPTNGTISTGNIVRTGP